MDGAGAAESAKELLVEASDASAGALVDVDAPSATEPPKPSAAPSSASDLEPWRSKLLSDPSLHEHVRKVARIRGGTRSEVDVVLSDVLFAALTDPNLPRSARDVRRRLGVVSRNKMVDIVRARGERFLSMATDLPPGTEATDAASNVESLVADRSQLEKLLAIAKERHPQTWRWAVRRYLEGDKVEDIALDARVSERRVRQALQQILATFAAAAATLGVVLLVLRARPELLFSDPSHTWAPATRTRTLEPRPDVVGPLREKAAFDYRMGAFSQAADELEQAYDLDPTGETPEQAAMRQDARHNHRLPEGDGKPVLRPGP